MDINLDDDTSSSTEASEIDINLDDDTSSSTEASEIDINLDDDTSSSTEASEMDNILDDDTTSSTETKEMDKILDDDATSSTEAKEMNAIYEEIISLTTGTNVTKESKKVDDYECAVCLQKCIQPVKLPCDHVFCYLCVKGIAQQSRNCALCRKQIPVKYLINPDVIAVEQTPLVFDGSYQWFYQGRNGWWQYDDRSSKEIEDAFQRGETQHEILIAGTLYTIDFQTLMQTKKDNSYSRRHIKRDLVTIEKKGVAGIRLQSDKTPTQSAANLPSTSTDKNTKKGTKRKHDSIVDTVQRAHQSVDRYSEVMASLLELQKKVLEYLIKK